MGAHAFYCLVRPLLLLVLCFLGCTLRVSNSAECDALLSFKSRLGNQEALSTWTCNTPPCQNENSSTWTGITCFYGQVWKLQLENMNLAGEISVDSLSRVPSLRALSLQNNRFTGPFPDIHKLYKLRSIYLSNNHFEGPIRDDAFAGMLALRRVVLSNNSFTGKVPSSLTTLPILVEVSIDGNRFEGEIPNFQQKLLIKVDVANNQLEGPIPQNLKYMDPRFFQGNKELCGPPLKECRDSLSSAITTMLILAVLLVIAVLVLIILLLIACCRRRRRARVWDSGSVSHHSNISADETYVPPAGTAEPGKLDFVRDDRKVFELSDLLTASAEVLESGNFMSSYKVEIFEGQLLVVKRYRQMNKVSREDFNEHVRRMGKLRHSNLSALVAFYYRKEEKILIFDFVDNGNLASRLHGNASEKQKGLDWAMRLKIIKGVARGLAYLYSELPNLTVPHGYLKSANIILDENHEPLLMDYALHPLINSNQSKQLLVAYKSPEYAQTNTLSKKSDVWCLGVLILEVLTGKFPTMFVTAGNANDETWVKDIETEYENKGDEVFDKEMKGTKNGLDQMRKLLKIGLSCGHDDVDIRWGIKDAVENIEGVQESDDSTSKE